MAFRVNSNTLVDNYVYISKHDEAVDHERPDFKHAWQLYLDGKADPPLRPGGKPTRWHFRHLTPRQRMRVIDRGGVEGLALALSMALVKVENLDDEKGVPFELEFVHEDGMRVVSEATMGALHAMGGDELLLDLCSRVQRSLDIAPKS